MTLTPLSVQLEGGGGVGAGVQIETGRVRARVQLVGGPTLFLSVDFVNILPKKGVDRH